MCQLKLSSAYELVFYQVATSLMSGKLLILIVTPPDACALEGLWVYSEMKREKGLAQSLAQS